jgi:hypothetical protein
MRTWFKAAVGPLEVAADPHFAVGKAVHRISVVEVGRAADDESVVLVGHGQVLSHPAP